MSVLMFVGTFVLSAMLSWEGAWKLTHQTGRQRVFGVLRMVHAMATALALTYSLLALQASH